MARLAEQPNLVAPASTIAKAVAASRMPPLALTAEAGPDGCCHQAHGRHRRAAGRVEAGGRLHVVGTRRLGGVAGGHDLIVGEHRRLDDDLEEHRVRRGGAHRRDVLAHRVPVSGHGEAEVDDHVDLGGAGVDRHLRLVSLDGRLMRAAREADHRADVDADTQAFGDRQVRRRHAHGGHSEVGGLLTERDHLVRGGLGLQQRVVDHGGEPGTVHRLIFVARGC